MAEVFFRTLLVDRRSQTCTLVSEMIVWFNDDSLRGKDELPFLSEFTVGIENGISLADGMRT